MDRRFEFVRQHTSRIVVGTGVEARLPELVREIGGERILVLHDEALTDLGSRLATRLGAATCFAVPATEPVKSLATLGELALRLRTAGADRRTTLVAVGGGTITDLVGFLAAIFLRGVRFVSCPTTTLAMCDAALGGKNGIDHGGLKNELGTIRQPYLIAGDVAWLDTLPDAPFREGLVEAVKKAAVLDAAHFARFEELRPALGRRDVEATVEAIELSVSMKMQIVREDEAERGRRWALNFGHTIGHAIESLANGALRHGECVAMGMLAECRAAGVLPAVTSRLDALLTGLGVATAVPPWLRQPERLWELARHDKKATQSGVPMYVPKALGHGQIVDLTAAALAGALAEALP